MMLLFFRARSVSASSLGLSSTSRITLWFISCLLGIRECEIERRALVHGPFGPDAPSMPVDDSLHGGQTNTRTLEFTRGMETLKCAEQFTDIGHVEARAVITDEISRLAVLLLPTKDYLRPGSLRCKFPGVAQQIVEHDSQQPFIPTRCELFLELEINLSLGLAFFEFSRDRASQVTQVNDFAAHLAARHARQLQHVVNQLRHLLARATHLPKVALTCVVKFVGVVLQQGLAKAVDVTQRRAQVVRD